MVYGMIRIAMDMEVYAFLQVKYPVSLYIVNIEMDFIFLDSIDVLTLMNYSQTEGV